MASKIPWFLSPAMIWQRSMRTSRFIWIKVLRIEATPHTIAIGLAAGVFIGLLPVLPFQTILAVALAFIVRGSKLAAALGTWVSNPLNWIPCYLAFYYVGKAVVPFEVPPLDIHHLEMMSLIQSGWELFSVMMIGGLLIATPSAFVTYFIAYKIILIYRNRKIARVIAKAKASAQAKKTVADSTHL